MSKYHYGPYSSLTPRLQSSNQASDLNSANALSNQLKPHQRSETLSPDAPKKSPTKISKASKSQLENQLKSSLASKPLKKSNKTTKGKTKKSNSPPAKDPLVPSNGETKKKTSKPQILMNNYELDNVGKHKSSSVKSLSIPQSMFSQPGYEANFANWLSEKVKSPKNANVNSLAGPAAHSAELGHTDEKGAGGAGDPQNVWPEAKKTYKIESQSHRQSLDSPTGTTNAKKSLQSQLSAFAGNTENQKQGHAEVEKISKGISKQKAAPQKLSLGSKDHIEVAKKLTLKVSPRALDPYIGLPHPLSTQSQTNTQPKMNSLDAQSLGSSYNFEFQRDAKRVSLDPSQSSYSQDQQLDFPKSAKNQTAPKGNFFKDSPKKEGDASSGVGGEEGKVIPARVKSAKHSDPNIYNDLNNYMHMMMNGRSKRASDSQLQGQVLAQVEGETHALSTRSALDKYENRLGVKSATVKQGEGQFLEEGGKSGKVAKKGDANGKFLSMKNQIQEKRSKTNFKSADWSIPSQNSQKQASGFEKSSRNEEPSPEQVARLRKKDEYSEDDKEGEPSKAQLYQILQRTEQVLTSYKHKENIWGKEKRELVAEVKYLRSVIEKLK